MTKIRVNNIRRKWLIIVLALLPALLMAGSGFMRVRSFNHKMYGGGPQNWDVVQDSIGRIYFGNRDCMIVFDGERFHKYGLPNSTTVRSLLYDHRSERIYAGGSQEFGFFYPDSISGRLRYKSLSKTFADVEPDFTEVWKIMKEGNNIWFQSDNYLMRFDGKETKVIWTEDRISASAIINSHLYIATENGNIMLVNGLTLNALPNTEILDGKKIVSLMPGVDGMLIGTSLHGLYYYDDDEAKRFDTPINTFLENNQLFKAAYNGSDYVFGTVTEGAVVANFRTNSFSYINKETGLQNNTVLNASFDRAGNVWLCLDNGLDYALYSSPVYNLIGSTDDIGTGYVTYRYGDRVYIGTNQGLYSTPYPFSQGPHRVETRRELRGQIWSITPLDDSFVVAGDVGVFVYTPSGFYKVEGVTGSYNVAQFNKRRNMAIASSYDGFHLLSNVGGRWQKTGVVDADQGLRGKAVVDADDRIWLNHWLKGVYRLWLNIDKHRFETIRLYDHRNGLPDNTGTTAIIHDGQLMVGDDRIIYTYNSDIDKFFASDAYNKAFKFGKDGTLINVDNNTVSVLDRAGIQLVKRDTGGHLSSVSIPFSSLKDFAVYGYEDVNYLSPKEYLVTNQEGVWSVDALTPSPTKWKPRPFISAIYANNDSLVYSARLEGGKAQPLKLPHDLNSLRIDFTYPDFQTTSEVKYSTYLENYDDDWSAYSKIPSREYTKLREGKYIFHVRIEDPVTGNVEETTLPIRILPPWHRSIWAWIFYSILIILGAWVAYYFIRKWKINSEKQILNNKEKELEKMRKEAEKEALQKDYEIATLKSEQLEVDIRHKSSELTSATMNLIRKNEILNDLSLNISGMQKQSNLPEIVKKQLNQLQKLIRENISHDDVWNDFNRNFDVVYQNYTKRLKEDFPQLTSSDIRMCCYIKMGLSSKEIAPLLNISYKSVEMARYRLRKKMNLDSEVNLSEYLINF